VHILLAHALDQARASQTSPSSLVGRVLINLSCRLRPKSDRDTALPRNDAKGHKRTFGVQADYAFSTRGGVHVPLRIEGVFSFGKYIRSIGRNSPFGAGSQLASLSAPGEVF
jgi:hypothetical protein